MQRLQVIITVDLTQNEYGLIQELLTREQKRLLRWSRATPYSLPDKYAQYGELSRYLNKKYLETLPDISAEKEP